MTHPERIADAGAAVAASWVAADLVIGQINPYLQALAYSVAIISGICAAIYHISAWRRGRNGKTDK